MECPDCKCLMHAHIDLESRMMAHCPKCGKVLDPEEFLKAKVICIFCSEELESDALRGWVHLDGKQYKRKPDGTLDHSATPKQISKAQRLADWSFKIQQEALDKKLKEALDRHRERKREQASKGR